MATKPPPKMITSWSFSRYSDYQQCPAKAKYKHVLRMKEPPNDAMARGTAIHTMAEDYIKGKLNPLQVEWHETWRGPIHVIRSLDDALMVVVV